MNTESSKRESKANPKGATTAVIDGDLYEPTEYGWRRANKSHKLIGWLGWLASFIALPAVYVYRRIRRTPAKAYARATS